MKTNMFAKTLATAAATLTLNGLLIARCYGDSADRRKEFTSVAAKATPAVVFIQVEKSIPVRGTPGNFNDPFDLFNDDFFERFFRHRMPRRPTPPRPDAPPENQYRQQGQGSGFIVSADGYVLTNNHVVGDADRITVKLADNREFTGEIVGTDAQTDVAVVKIKADNLPVLPLGDSDALEVGEWVMAIGNPFGLAHTVTAGIVSAKGRSTVGIADYEDFIQTDAAINPGNSGGPLLNLDGEAVGINTAIFSRNGGYMGIGFAIPVNMARNIYAQLIKKGEITRGYMGVAIQDLSPQLAESFGLKEAAGVLVSEVVKGSPADTAGVRTGDVIIQLGGKDVGNVGAFRNDIALSEPGTTVKLTVVRNRRPQTLAVTLGKLDAAATAAAASPRETEKRLGLSVQDLNAELAQRYGYETAAGVIVANVEPGSVAAMAGLKLGNLVVEVDRKPVSTAAAFHAAVAEALKDGSVLLLVRQGPYSRFVVLHTE